MQWITCLKGQLNDFSAVACVESAGETSVLGNDRVFRGRAMYRRRVVVMVQLIMHGWKAQEKLLCFLVIDAFG